MEAQNLLQKLRNQVSEAIQFSQMTESEKRIFHYSYSQLSIIENTINSSDDFFEQIFKDKTEGEIIEWIEGEYKQWKNNCPS